MEKFGVPLAAPREIAEPTPVAVRKPRFPRSPLEKESSKFIDPRQEAAILLPQQAQMTMPVQLALESQMATEKTIAEKKSNAAYAIYELLLSWFNAIKKRLSARERRRVRVTRQGEEALTQLRYLALLCDATEARTPEEVLAAEGAFGEAYYEILNLSSNLERMAQKEEEHHVRRYRRHMSAILQSTP